MVSRGSSSVWMEEVGEEEDLKSMIDDDCYLANSSPPNPSAPSSSSCSPSSVFKPFSQFPLATQMLNPPLLMGLGGRPQMGSNPMTIHNSPFLNRSKFLRPLEVVGGRPTLFQKRAESSVGSYETHGDRSIDGSGLNYDSGDDGNNSNGNSTVTGSGGEHRGKKKALPAKNLLVERRKRKKLNDRLYMLRSMVPKISKMDRASILGDAIEYLNELLQRINDLYNELESMPYTSSLLTSTNSTGFHPTLPTLPCRVKEEVCPRSLSSPNSHQARVEVSVIEGQAVNIHMLCAPRPGLLLSTIRALDSLGLDIQQAVISCFDGFVLDVFRAECNDSPGPLPEEIKTVLLQSAGFHTVM